MKERKKKYDGCGAKERATKVKKETTTRKVDLSEKRDSATESTNEKHDDKGRDDARLKECMKTVKRMLRGDKENLAKLGKHELMAFYDTRFKSENDSKGALMIVFGDTLNMGKENTIMVVSCGNVLLKKCVYGYAVDGNGDASIGRVDKKPVTMEDGKVLVKAYEKFMGNVKKKCQMEDKVKRN